MSAISRGGRVSCLPCFLFRFSRKEWTLGPRPCAACDVLSYFPNTNKYGLTDNSIWNSFLSFFPFLLHYISAHISQRNTTSIRHVENLMYYLFSWNFDDDVFMFSIVYTIWFNPPNWHTSQLSCVEECLKSTPRWHTKHILSSAE